MSTCSIDAVYHGEERYSKLSLAFSNEDERQKIESLISEITPKYNMEPTIYTSDISNGRKVLVIEYNDDYDREAGAIFEEMLKRLGIDSCECD